MADREAGRVIAALGARAASTLVVIAADHGEAFGEHGELTHSIFVYDSTLRVPLLMRGPGIPAAKTVSTPVSLVGRRTHGARGPRVPVHRYGRH